MKQILSLIIFIIALAAYLAGAGGAIYSCFYLGIVKPLMTLGAHFDNDTLTGAVIAKEAIFFLCRHALALVSLVVGVMVGSFLMGASRELALHR